MDVKMTFLNSVLEEEANTKEPEGFSYREGEHLVCKLKKIHRRLETSLQSIVLQISSSDLLIWSIENPMD